MHTSQLIYKFEELYSPDIAVAAYAGWSVERLAANILKLNPAEPDARAMAATVIEMARHSVSPSVSGPQISPRKTTARIHTQKAGRPRRAK
jgi:hypothetical protein